MSAVLALAAKDLRVLARVRAGWFFTFVWPLVVAVLFGSVFGDRSAASTPASVRVAVVDEDASDASRRFIARMESSGHFAVQQTSRADAETAVRLGRQSAFVIVAPGFGRASERLFHGEPRRLEIGVDPSRGAEAAMIEGLLTKLAMEDVQNLFSDRTRSRRMVDETLRELERQPGTASLDGVKRFLGELDRFLADDRSAVAGDRAWQPLELTRTDVARRRRGPANAYAITFPQAAVWGIIGCVMTFAIGLVSERVHGTFLRIAIAPLTRAQILGGKALACFVSILFVELLLFAIARIGFGVQPMSGPLLATAGVCAALGFVGFMMMIAGLGRTEQAVAGAGWALLLPLAMVGGAMIPQFIMPGWMAALGNISPIKWTILALEGAVWRGFSAAEMLAPCAALVVFGAACFAIGVRGLKD